MRRTSPLTVALLSCSLLVLGGAAAITVGYVIAARTLDVFDQVPAIVSGGIGGMALILTGCVLGYVQVGRACAERERTAEDGVLVRIGALAEIERRRSPAKKRGAA
jgi:hypothetical protein